MKVIKRYLVKNCDSVVIPNYEIMEIIESGETVQLFNEMFKSIEKTDTNVMEVLTSPEIEKIFSKKIKSEIYDARHLWTAHVRPIENMNYTIFIGGEKHDEW